MEPTVAEQPTRNFGKFQAQYMSDKQFGFSRCTHHSGFNIQSSEWSGLELDDKLRTKNLINVLSSTAH